MAAEESTPKPGASLADRITNPEPAGETSTAGTGLFSSNAMNSALFVVFERPLKEATLTHGLQAPPQASKASKARKAAR